MHQNDGLRRQAGVDCLGEGADRGPVGILAGVGRGGDQQTGSARLESHGGAPGTRPAYSDDSPYAVRVRYAVWRWAVSARCRGEPSFWATWVVRLAGAGEVPDVNPVRVQRIEAVVVAALAVVVTVAVGYAWWWLLALFLVSA
jgi:hypothetical protein